MGTQLNKHCGCGARFDSVAWSRLPFIGLQCSPGIVLELRQCTCGTCLAICLEGADLLAGERLTEAA